MQGKQLLSQTLGQVLRTRVVVPHQHAQVFVPGDLRQFVHGKDRSQARRSLMPQVVKSQVGQKPAVRALPCRFAFLNVKLAGSAYR